MIAVITAIAVVGVSAALLYEHGGDPAMPASRDGGGGADLAEHVAAGNLLAADLYSALSDTADASSNLFFSPPSIAAAFTVAYEGAGGRTAAQMQEALGIPGDGGGMDGLGQLYRDLTVRDRPYDLTLANALWMKDGFRPEPAFVDTVAARYDGHVESVDIAGAGINRINGWIAESTGGNIRDMLDPDSVDSQTVMIITNAIYFKGGWAEQFNPVWTSERPFWIGANTSVTVPMMETTDRYLYAETADLKALQKNYEGGDLSMLILLPKERTGITVAEKSLDPTALLGIRDMMRPEAVLLEMPRFSFSTNYELPDAMRALGITDAFDPDLADFEGMSGDERLYIGDALHAAFVDVGEEGTEASAATSVSVLLEGGGNELTAAFTADHPFIFVIRNNDTGQILFVGRVMDPSA